MSAFEPPADPTHILAFDPGTTTGYALLNAHTGELVMCGLLDLKGGRFDSFGARFLKLMKVVDHMLEIYSPSLVAFEDVKRHEGTYAAQVYGGLTAILSSTAELVGAPQLGIPVATVKKTATGRGNANKDAVWLAAVKEWPKHFNAKDERLYDMSDACWIGRAAYNELVTLPS